MGRTITSEQLNEICDAANILCDFCESDECEKCIVNRLINDAYNEYSDVSDEYDDEVP